MHSNFNFVGQQAESWSIGETKEIQHFKKIEL